MASTWNRAVIKDVSTTIEQLYAAPSDKKGSVNNLTVCNKSAATDSTVTVKVYPLGVAGNAVEIYHDYPLNAGETVEFDGVKLLLKTDEIWIEAGDATTLDAHVSVIEETAT